MEGSAYIWGFLVPAVVLLFAGFYLACQGGGAVKIAAALQIDSRAKNKLVKKRGLQIGLFFKVSLLQTVVDTCHNVTYVNVRGRLMTGFNVLCRS